MKQQPHVEQALAELDTATERGDVEAETRARKVLAAADVDDKAVAAARRARGQATNTAPAGRSGKSGKLSTAEPAAPSEQG